jgi:hypothetical protein
MIDILNNLDADSNTLINRARDNLYNNVRTSDNPVFGGMRAIIPSPSNYLGFWNWDGAFHMIGAAYFDQTLSEEQAKIMLPIALSHQEK